MQRVIIAACEQEAFDGSEFLVPCEFFLGDGVVVLVVFHDPIAARLAVCPVQRKRRGRDAVKSYEYPALC